MPRPRSVLLPALVGVALAAAGCGGDAASVEEVPGAPPVLSVPHQKGADELSGGADGATPTPTPGADADATEAPAETGTTGETAAPTGAAATPAPATEDSPTSDQAPAAGSPPEQFEQFCEENAGAC